MSFADDEDRSATCERLFGPDSDFDHVALWGPDPYDVITDEMDDGEQDRAMEKAMAAGSTLHIPFPSGHTWSIRFSSSPGIYHDLTDSAGTLDLGYDDPHFHLPILRWAEAMHMADHLRRHWSDLASPPFPAEFLLPLLAPVAWAASAREVAVVRVALAEAWAATAMIPTGSTHELAERLVGECDVGRRPDPVLGWTNDARHSHRNPSNGFWSPEDAATFRRFLDGLDRPWSPIPDISRKVTRRLWRRRSG
jgi:hypothetical protein